MVIILIRRCVKREKEQEFLEKYTSERPKHEDFIDEILTRLQNSDQLPDSLRNLTISCGDNCVTYLNVARWKSAKSFQEHFNPQIIHDPDIECADRARAVFEIIAGSHC